jgi:hypothetical protein
MSGGSKGDGPTFAREFPADPGLDALLLAFRDGNYARVRRDAPAIVTGAASEDVKRAAAELVRRTKADPIMVWLLVVTGVLLASLSVYWMTRP